MPLNLRVSFNCHVVSFIFLFSVFFWLQIKLVNINATDIADGRPSIVLGLLWTIILYFQVKAIDYILKLSLSVVHCKFPLCIWSTEGLLSSDAV